MFMTLNISCKIKVDSMRGGTLAKLKTTDKKIHLVAMMNNTMMVSVILGSIITLMYFHTFVFYSIQN